MPTAPAGPAHRGVTPASRRMRRALVVLTAAATLPLTGCTSLPTLEFQKPSASEPSTSAKTAPATTVAERVRQSELDTKLGTGYASAKGNGVMVVASAGTPIPGRVTQVSEKAAAAIRELDPQASKNPLLVVVPRDEAAFKRYTGEDVGTKLAVSVTGGGRLPFVVLSPARVHDAGSALTRETLAHESFHALTLEHLAADRPLWLLEGWAEYAGQHVSPVSPHKRSDISPHLPSDEELTGSQADRAYYTAFSFARYLKATYGAQKVMAFYTAAVTTPEGLEALANTYFGHGTGELETGYAAWYRTFA